MEPHGFACLYLLSLEIALVSIIPGFCMGPGERLEVLMFGQHALY